MLGRLPSQVLQEGAHVRGADRVVTVGTYPGPVERELQLRPGAGRTWSGSRTRWAAKADRWHEGGPRHHHGRPRGQGGRDSQTRRQGHARQQDLQPACEGSQLGHPHNTTLSKVLKDAWCRKEVWRAALHLKCRACQRTRRPELEPVATYHKLIGNGQAALSDAFTREHSVNHKTALACCTRTSRPISSCR